MEKEGVVCLKSELDLFTNTAVQLGIDASSFVEIHPIASLTDKTPIEFYINPLSGSTAFFRTEKFTSISA